MRALLRKKNLFGNKSSSIFSFYSNYCFFKIILHCVQSYVNNQHMECKVMSGSLDSTYKEDMGMVRDGSRCADQRICMNQTCLALSTFQAWFHPLLAWFDPLLQDIVVNQSLCLTDNKSYLLKFLKNDRLWKVIVLCSLVLPEYNQDSFHEVQAVHCKKRVSNFPVPSRDVTNQTLPDGEFFN